MEKIKVDGTRLVTESGKQVILHGINIVCKYPEKGYLEPDLEELFLAYSRKGMNLIRLGIFWDGVEPEPGKYDEEYLKRVKAAVRSARDCGLYILLDMHQDLYARKYGDGAPDWATLDEGAFHPENCTMWYEAYLESNAIIQAADRFWANAPAPDGMGLLDHYEKMWEHLAETFADCDNIIGFEPMNEPFMGSLARNAFGTATGKLKEKNPAFDLGNPGTVSQEQAAEFMALVTEQLQEFDRTVLMDFYRRIERAVQKHSDKALVTGGNIYCSSNVRTGIGRLESGNQIYAPHGYDSVVDSDRYENFSRENVERLFQDKRSSQMELKLPVIVGEWGAFPPKDFTGSLLDHMKDILETYLWGSAYWQHMPGLEKEEAFHALRRAYPMETAGRLKEYHYDREHACYTMSYEGEAGGVTRIFCPFYPAYVEGNRGIQWSCTEKGPESYELYVTSVDAGKLRLEVRSANGQIVTVQPC